MIPYRLLIEFADLPDDERLVHEGRMPAFNQIPQVVFWGNRTFKLHSDRLGGQERSLVYVECFAWSAVGQ